MTRLLTAKEICERSLRRIRAFPITETAAQPEDLAEALFYLDMMVGYVAGTNRLFFLVPATLSMALTGGEQTYDIVDTLAANAPDDGVQFPIEAILVDPSGNRSPLNIVSRQAFEEHSDLTQAVGEPVEVHIDRLQGPTLRTYPTLDSTATGYSIDLVVQTFAPDLTKSNGQQVTSLRAAWNLWAVIQLAIYIGGGPVRTLPEAQIKRDQDQADKLLNELQQYENREHTGAPRVAFRDF